MTENSNSEQKDKYQLGATISVLSKEIGSISITASPEDWYDINHELFEEIELIGNGLVINGADVQDKWFFHGGKDGFLDVTYVDDEDENVVILSTRLRNSNIVEHPTPHRKPKKITNFSHEEMASIVKKQTYSTTSGCIGETDTRPVVWGKFIVPVAYAHYDVPVADTTLQTNWPAGDIVGYLRNTIEGDALIFPAWKGYTRCKYEDVIYVLTKDGWVKRH